MNETTSQDLIVETLNNYGLMALGIIVALVTIGVAYLIYKFGKKEIHKSLNHSHETYWDGISWYIII